MLPSKPNLINAAINTAIIAALFSLMAWAQSDDAKAANPARAEPTHIPEGVCPGGHVGMWVERDSVECLKELP